MILDSEKVERFYHTCTYMYETLWLVNKVSVISRSDKKCPSYCLCNYRGAK